MKNSVGLTLAGATMMSATAASAGQRQRVSANNRISVGVVGLGNRGTTLTKYFLDNPEVEISYLCDVNCAKFASAAALVDDAQGHVPKRVQDFREMLADKTVDAVVVATGHNWHSLATIWSCQAGKDVYVEKPMSLTLYEGRKMVEAARKYKRIVQVGSQTNSATYFRDALDYVRSGRLAAFLIDKKADVNAQTRAGQTPLHTAVGAGHLDVAELLVNKGADVNVKDKKGRTPLDAAEEAGHTEIVELLRKHGAKE